MESKSNKTSEIVCLVIGIIAFVVTAVIQSGIARSNDEIVGNIIAQIQADTYSKDDIISQIKASDTSINGIISQFQVIISTLLVILSRRKGFIAGVILNLISVLFVAVQIFKSGNLSSVPGIVVPLCTVITIAIIYMFSSRTRKMHDELTESYNQIVESNRIMKEKDEKLSYLAYYDVLTNMPNRQFFIDKLEENIENNMTFTVIYADIDDFKMINDMYGHNAGDVMLCTFAERLNEFCSERDFTGRIGGDEFVIILNGVDSDVRINDYINKIRSVISEPVAVNGTLLHVTMSYGVVSCPLDCRNSEDILRFIDIAMVNAKSNGKDRPCFYSRLHQTAG